MILVDGVIFSLWRIAGFPPRVLIFGIGICPAWRTAHPRIIRKEDPFPLFWTMYLDAVPEIVPPVLLVHPRGFS